MKFEALAQGCHDGCLNIAVALQPIVGFHDAKGTFGTGRVLALNSQRSERIKALLNSGFKFSPFRARLLRSPHPR